MTPIQDAELELPDEMRDQMRAAWHRYLDRVTPIRPALHAYCRRLTHNLWDAEDLVQDTLMKGFGSLGGVHDPIRNPRAYLLRIATNLWIDRLHAYGFCPDTVRAVAESLGLRWRGGPYRYPTPEPGKSF